jgi:hypothetical protein
MGAITYVTLGMSNFVLPLSDVKQVRLELLFTAWANFNSKDISWLLIRLCDLVLSKKQALLRGDVVGPNTSVIPGVAANAVYAAMPVIFCNELAVFKETDPPTVVVWVLPIMEEEAKFIRSNGWSKFEDLLEACNPDLLDLNRPSTVCETTGGEPCPTCGQ